MARRDGGCSADGLEAREDTGRPRGATLGASSTLVGTASIAATLAAAAATSAAVVAATAAAASLSVLSTVACSVTCGPVALLRMIAPMYEVINSRLCPSSCPIRWINLSRASLCLVATAAPTEPERSRNPSSFRANTRATRA